MRGHIGAGDNLNEPILGADNPLVPLIYFNLVRLDAGQEATVSVPGFETMHVVMSGSVDVVVDNEAFTAVGRRQDIWSGRADSVYAPAGADVRLRARRDGTEVAVAGGRCATRHAPFRVSPEDVDMVDVGSSETKSHRRIFHILGQNGRGRAGNLLVSELYCEEGCWSGYPPHKHDTARDGETDHQEVYHYRFRPETGFGAQYRWVEGEPPEVAMTRHGDTFVIDRGYHPTVTSPGHEEYIFTILVGRDQRSLVQHFHERHAHLMDVIPGIADMREKFK